MNIDIPKEKLSNYDYVLRWLKEDLKQAEQGQKKAPKEEQEWYRGFISGLGWAVKSLENNK